MAYVLFFLAGLGFGYAAAGLWKFLPLLFPLVLAVGAFVRDGIHGTALLKLVVAVVVMLLGILLARCSSSEVTAARRLGPASRAQLPPAAAGRGRGGAGLARGALGVQSRPGTDGLARLLELTPAVESRRRFASDATLPALLRAPYSGPPAAGRVRDRWQPSRACNGPIDVETSVRR